VRVAAVGLVWAVDVGLEAWHGMQTRQTQLTGLGWSGLRIHSRKGIYVFSWELRATLCSGIHIPIPDGQNGG
jgi:hypothetical protein